MMNSSESSWSLASRCSSVAMLSVSSGASSLLLVGFPGLVSSNYCLSTVVECSGDNRSSPECVSALLGR